MAKGAELPPEQLVEGINSNSEEPAVCIAEDSAINRVCAARAALPGFTAAPGGSASTVVVIAHAMSDCLQVGTLTD